jgi:MFS family permease
MAIADSYTILMVGRFFIGLGVGFGLAIDPLYIAEVTPASHRGELVTWSEIGTNVGILLGFFSGVVFYGMDKGSEWRLMFIMGAFLPIVMIFLVLKVMPESPRWYGIGALYLIVYLVLKESDLLSSSYFSKVGELWQRR